MSQVDTWNAQLIAEALRAWEFAGVVADEHGHGDHPASSDCDHPSHLLERLAAQAIGVRINHALATSGATLDTIRHDLADLGHTGVDIATAIAIFSRWQEQHA